MMVLAHSVNEKIRTKDIHISQNVTFDTMLLSQKTSEGLQNSGFYKPSPVQLHGIPLGKCGFDLLLEAKSGTGKTAVFTVIALEKIDLNLNLQVIILTPTREIAAQVCDVLKQIGSAYDGLCVEVAIGGLPVKDDITKFSSKNVHIVVGSPGRLKHLILDKHIDVSSVRLLVLDEADKLMEKSFLGDIKYIHSILPKQKQVIMSSATYPDSCKEITQQFVHGAQHICPENNCVLLGVYQKVTHVKYNSNIIKQTKVRFDELLKILSNIQFKQCLIFCNYQVRVAELHRMLTKANWPVEMLHGQQEQTDRLDVLKTLQEYKCRILISTDLASRGIDSSNIDLVINFEPPIEWQTYLHRIGRAGRFGSYGTAITILSEGIEQKKFTALFDSLNSTQALGQLWVENEMSNNSDNNEGSKDVQPSEKEIKTETYELGEQGKSSQLINVKEDSKKTNNTHLSDCYNLLFSKQEPKMNVESFTDLLQSYENYDSAKQKANTKYRCINFPDILHDEKDVPNIQNLKKDNLKINKPKTENNEEKSASILEMQKGVNIKQNEVLTEYIPDDNESNMDLIRLGLPTAFSSSKYKNINKKYFREKCNKNKLRDENFDCNNADNNNISLQDTYVNNKFKLKNFQCTQQKKHNRRKYNTTETSSESDNMENKNIGFTMSNNVYRSEKDRIKHDPAHYNYTNKDESWVKNYSKSYTAWYKQMKLKTKQIELALYIQELSGV